jgi:hypothetical protein
MDENNFDYLIGTKELTFTYWNGGNKDSITGKLICIDNKNRLVIQISNNDFKFIPQCRIWSFKQPTFKELFKYEFNLQ